MPKAVGVELTHAPDVPQKLYCLLTWAVQRGHLKPIDAPPTTLLETLKPKCIGYPLSDAQILQLLANLSQGEAHDRVRFAFSPVPSTGSVLRSCATSPQGRGRRIGTLDDASEVDGRQPST